ncbi:hypothetical protein KSB_47230 [Ktedonobacter robiniae]|uniref:Uncharacterized protein n=1 Tax=Ktedonobacter robiniae TaxID=2778365 RepID=A0ABQ3UU06_9CHLR|nr:hypothetical protein KSB_47230 [Ktedonobacter robiniae]
MCGDIPLPGKGLPPSTLPLCCFVPDFATALSSHQGYIVPTADFSLLYREQSGLLEVYVIIDLDTMRETHIFLTAFSPVVWQSETKT